MLVWSNLLAGVGDVDDVAAQLTQAIFMLLPGALLTQLHPAASVSADCSRPSTKSSQSVMQIVLLASTMC